MERKLDGMPVLQRTSDGFFNATAIVKQWNERVEDDKCQFHHRAHSPIIKHRDLKDYFDFSQTKEYLEAVRKEENIYEVVKASRANKGDNAGTWVHPLVFVDLCMWLNPEFKVKVLKFVRDELMFLRNEVGDCHNEFKDALSAAGIDSSDPLDWIKFQSAFNKWAFGKGNNELNKSSVEGIHSAVRKYSELRCLVEHGFFGTMGDVIRHIAAKNNRIG